MVFFFPGIFAPGGVHAGAVNNGERGLEAFFHFPLPLVFQVAGGDDEDALC